MAIPMFREMRFFFLAQRRKAAKVLAHLRKFPTVFPGRLDLRHPAPSCMASPCNLCALASLREALREIRISNAERQPSPAFSIPHFSLFTLRFTLNTIFTFYT